MLLVLPQNQITGIGGFIDAVSKTFTVYGGAQGFLLDLMTLAFIGTLVTSGAVWMIGSDRVQAIAAADGAWFPWFGVFNKRFGTPVRVNVMSGIVSTAFTIVAIEWFNNGDDASFAVVLTMAISTTLISYLFVFPTVIRLRHKFPNIERPYTVPFGMRGVWIGVILTTFWIALGSWASVFPGTLEPLIGVDYGSFVDAWGVTRWKFEALTFGTLGIIVVLAVGGYLAAGRTRSVVAPREVVPAPD